MNQYSYTLLEQHENTLPEAGLTCDGTVTILPTDAVCYALVSLFINGKLLAPQKIMNVPFQDDTKLPLYLTYFMNDQASQQS